VHGVSDARDFSGDASSIEDVLLSWSRGLTLVEPYLEEAHVEELSDDCLVVGAAPSIEHIDPICTEPLDLTTISSPLLLTTPSRLHAFYESLCDIRGHNPSLNPYYAYIEDMPRKIEWTTFFCLFVDIRNCVFLGDQFEVNFGMLLSHWWL